MRRQLLILLLVLLPIQFVWGSAASYCQHEQRNGSSHFGHHVHKHAERHAREKTPKHPGTLAQSPSDFAPETGSPLAAEDVDCGSCHSHCAQPLVPATPACFIESAPLPRLATSTEFHSPLVPALIERPKWTLAA